MGGPAIEATVIRNHSKDSSGEVDRYPFVKSILRELDDS